MKDLNAYIVTFNCARTLVQSDVFGTYLFQAIPESQRTSLPDILVLALEEVAPIGIAFLGGSFLTPYYNAFRHAVRIATDGSEYTNIITRNVGLTSMMVFAKPEIASDIAYIQTAGVGFGFQDMGNKGAVGIRLGVRVEENSEVMETTFVAAHLAPMEDAREQRNEDWKSIVQRLVFVDDKTGGAVRHDESSEEAPLLQGLPASETRSASGLFTPRSHIFLAGDLNYRISDSPPTPEDHKHYPKPKASVGDPLHYSSFLPRDQLSKELANGKTLHGLKEAPINFPPTYKYGKTSRVPAQTDDVEAWDWSKHRWPSWCDRILYLDLPKWMKSQSPQQTIRIHGYTSLPLFLTSDHRAVALALSLPWAAIPSPPDGTENDVRLSPPFDIDPDWKAKRAIARKKELVVGLAAYLGLTWEGNGVLAATIIGALGGYLILKSLLAA